MAVKHLILPTYTPQQSARFWRKVLRRPDSDCWPWLGTTTRFGYGITVRGTGAAKRRIPSHRVAYFLSYGADPRELFVCHTCDNPSCCNPAHLFLGTHDDNMSDAKKKQRHRRGESHPHHQHPERLPRGDSHPSKLHPERLRRGEAQTQSKLKEEDVREIRRRYTQVRGARIALAREFGIDPTLVSRIVKRQAWKHVA